MLVELKNGDTYNGQLVNCDTWMNINLREVICTSKDGDRFWKMSECYVRGNMIKYIRVPNEIIELVKEEEEMNKYERHTNRGRGGGRGARGAGGGGFRGRGGGRGGGRIPGGGRGGAGAAGRGRGRGRGQGGRSGTLQCLLMRFENNEPN